MTRLKAVLAFGMTLFSVGVVPAPREVERNQPPTDLVPDGPSVVAVLPSRPSSQDVELQKREASYYRGGLVAGCMHLGGEGIPEFFDRLSKDTNEWEFMEAGLPLLDSPDPVARAMGAGIVSEVGGRTEAFRIALLIQEPRPPHRMPDGCEDTNNGFDRGAAASLLGGMQATEYAGLLLAMLQSDNEHERMGAALGLGLMREPVYADNVAGLLADEDGYVCGHAIKALVMLDARQYIPRLVGLLSDRAAGHEPREEAMWALAALGARESAPAIAACLRESCLFFGNTASVTLAVLGAREYTDDIAGLLDPSADDDCEFAREGALLALALLGAVEKTPEITAWLEDGDDSVRATAATALALLGADEYAEEALACLEQPDGTIKPRLYGVDWPVSFEGVVEELERRGEESGARMQARRGGR